MVLKRVCLSACLLKDVAADQHGVQPPRPAASTFVDLSHLEVLALPISNLILGEREPVRA
jgi:hypothetical protein